MLRGCPGLLRHNFVDARCQVRRPYYIRGMVTPPLMEVRTIQHLHIFERSRKMRYATVILALASAVPGFAQDTTSESGISASSSASASAQVPTGTPIVGDYDGRYRPQVHFSPPQYFMNDPNGMFVDDNGTWHLYYQYNPTALVAGNQHWGHATSQDLYHWTNQVQSTVTASGASLT
jgi:hypothetical protein